MHNIYNLQRTVSGYYGEFYVTLDHKFNNVSIWYRDNLVHYGGAVYNTLSKTNKQKFDTLIRNYTIPNALYSFDGKKFMKKIGAY